MVTGPEVFRHHSRDHGDRYLLIGGAACDILMSAAGLSFRATKDLDIVLCVEALDASFVRAFWEFVRTGGYESRERADGRKQYYRFQRPRDRAYPAMLELFARMPDALELAAGSHLTPLPMEQALSSLSAILMEDAYYDFIRAGRLVRDGLPLVGPERLIPLKARAWLDLKRRKEQGESVDSASIKKHRNDVFRLYPIVDPDVDIRSPEAVTRDIAEFLVEAANDAVDLKALGVTGVTHDEIFNGLRALYRLA